MPNQFGGTPPEEVTSRSGIGRNRKPPRPKIDNNFTDPDPPLSEKSLTPFQKLRLEIERYLWRHFKKYLPFLIPLTIVYVTCKVTGIKVTRESLTSLVDHFLNTFFFSKS